MKMRSYALKLFVLSVALTAAGCSYAFRATVPAGARPPIAELWADPGDLSTRDLFAGPQALGPPPTITMFRFVSRDTTGASPGYDVLDDRDEKWSVKLGQEVQPEIVVSRLLWAVGFHQPPTYFIRTWSLTGPGADPGPQPHARFRPNIAGYHVVGEWSWFKNPFVGTIPFEGLIAANVLLNNWDFKTSNNKIYERKQSGGDLPSHLYVVRDLGGSLGKTSQPRLLSMTGLIRALPGTKNDIDGFEHQGFVKLDSHGKPRFDYKGPRRDLLDGVSVEGVIWACTLMSGISDRQFADAFRAANYDPALASRFAARIRQRIAEGLALKSPTARKAA